MTELPHSAPTPGELISDSEPPQTAPAAGAELVPTLDPAVEEAIRDWRDSLLNLAGTNRLLNFRPSKTSTIEVVQPAAAVVLSALSDQRALRFRSVSGYMDPQTGSTARLPAPMHGVLDTLKDEEELGSALRLLARRSKQEYLDRGVWVLYLAVGMLRWTDDGTAYASPLLLVPVRMVRTGLRQLPVLEIAEEDPVVNPALSLKMSLYGVELPGVDLLEDLSLDQMLDEVRSAVADHPGWSVEASVVVSCFSFHKEAMYRDPIEHQQAIAEHPIVTALAGRNNALMEALDLRRASDAAKLAELLDALAERPAAVPTGWLTASGLDEVRSTTNRLAIDLAATATAEQEASSAAGIPWQRLPDPAAEPESDAAAPGAGATAPPDAEPAYTEEGTRARLALETDELTPEQAGELADTFAADADRLHNRIRSLHGITSMLGLRPVGTVRDARETLTVAEIAFHDERPEREWLSPAGLTAAKAAATALRDAIERLEAAEGAARPYFTDAALTADLTGLSTRFDRTHHGVKKLLAGYRADKRALAAVAAANVSVEDAITRLARAVEWQRVAAEYAAVVARHAGALGGYYTGRGTDLDRLDRVLVDAAVAVRRTFANGAVDRDSVLADCLAADRQVPPHPALADLVTGTRRDLEDWVSRLAPGPMPATPPELARWPLDEVVAWLQQHARALRSAAGRAGALRDAVGRRLTLGEATNIVATQAAARAAQAALASRADEYARVCEDLYRGAATDVAAVRGAMAWAERARAILTGADAPFTPSQIEAMNTATATPPLAPPRTFPSTGIGAPI